MKVLLVYPEFPITYWSYKHALKFVGKRSSFPPLGLLTVAALLPKEWEPRLVDMNVRRLSQKDLEWADLVMISAMVVQRASVLDVVKRAKELGKRVAAGGPLFSCEPDAFPQIDHLVLGEAESSLPDFLADFESGKLKSHYRTPGYPQLDATPIPRWDLIRMRDYASMCIQYSRGCPFNCDFCNVTTLFGRRPRVKAPAQIVAELDALWDADWRGTIFFVDDNLIGNKKHAKEELLPVLIEWQRKHGNIPFFTEASINLADDEELMEMMSEAGFDAVFIGLETPDDGGLAECNKLQNRGRDMLACIKKIQRFGLQVQGGFIVGFDSDPPSIFQRQIDFIQKSGVVTAMVGILQAPAGTGLYERMKREGRLLGEMLGDNANGITNILPKMGLDLLTEGYRKIFRGIYQPAPYYKRVRTFLREYRRPKVRTQFDWSKVRAFLRSTVRLGIIGRERFHYWGLLIWVLWRRADLLPEAITLAITGHHYRRVYEKNQI